MYFPEYCVIITAQYSGNLISNQAYQPNFQIVKTEVKIQYAGALLYGKTFLELCKELIYNQIMNCKE